MDMMTFAKFHFNQLMLNLIFGIRASEPPPRAWRTTEKAGPDRINRVEGQSRSVQEHIVCSLFRIRSVKAEKAKGKPINAKMIYDDCSFSTLRFSVLGSFSLHFACAAHLLSQPGSSEDTGEESSVFPIG